MLLDQMAVSGDHGRPIIILRKFGNNFLLFLTRWIKHADREASSDGTDGPTSLAGAITDGSTKIRAAEKGICGSSGILPVEKMIITVIR